MRITVVGGTGLIGTRVVRTLQDRGHDVVTASRATGVNSYTGEGLAAALDGAEVVVDVSNSSYLDAAGAIDFFYGSTLNLLNYGRAAGVRHHVALSVVGTDRLARTEGGYFAGKLAQERLIEQSGLPYSIVHATQFFEFVKSIVDAAFLGQVVRLSRALIQPMAADDVAAAVATTALGAPIDGMIEFGGPQQYRLEDLAREHLAMRDDPREVIADPLATYFGTALEERDLLPGADATLTSASFEEWLASPR